MRIVNASLDDPRSPPLTSIIRTEGGERVRYETEEGVKTVFSEECTTRYNLAKKAPIMKLSLAQHEDVLQADFAHLASIMEGQSDIPADLDEATTTYLQEVIEIAKRNQLDPDCVLTITKFQFTSFWSKVRESTQSSPYSLHYGAYKAAAKDDYTSEVLALQLNLVTRSGVHPVRWEVAMQLLMTKLKGECDIENCRYLFFMRLTLTSLSTILLEMLQMIQ